MSSADTTASAGPRLLGPADVRSLATSLGIRPTKQRGQNFVIDPNTVRRIVRAAGLADTGETVLEIGPGLGSLTLALLAEHHRVIAVEIDSTLARALTGTVATYAPAQVTHLSVIEADALDVTPEQLNPEGPRPRETPEPPSAPREADPEKLEPGAPARGDHGRGDPGGVALEGGVSGVGFGAPSACVANLPYNVAVPVLLHLLEICPSLRHGLVMVQAEVADRLAAEPGSRTYGVPSAKAAWYAEVRRAGAIGRNVFWPAPNVDSGLVAFTRREPPATDVSREEVFAVIDAAFSQRRKTVRSALARWLPDRARLDGVLATAGIDPTARGETLSIHDFSRIAAAGH